MWLIEAAHNTDTSAARKFAADASVTMWLQSSGKISPTPRTPPRRRREVTISKGKNWLLKFDWYTSIVQLVQLCAKPQHTHRHILSLAVSSLQSFLFYYFHIAWREHVRKMATELRWRRCREIINKIDIIRMVKWVMEVPIGSVTVDL